MEEINPAATIDIEDINDLKTNPDHIPTKNEFLFTLSYPGHLFFNNLIYPSLL